MTSRPTRRTGKTTSVTRSQLLDSVEALMVESGYASVTYRAVARHAAVTPSLVQYYFPTLDDLLVATIRRRSDQALARFRAMLADHPEQPARVIWEFSTDETDATLTMEFSALGNHRESVRRQIVEYTQSLRAIQLEALRHGPRDRQPDISPEASLFLLSGIPKMLRMEERFEVLTGHDDTVRLVEALIDGMEPPTSAEDA